MSIWEIYKHRFIKLQEDPEESAKEHLATKGPHLPAERTEESKYQPAERNMTPN